jgi:hypothetical protein
MASGFQCSEDFLLLSARVAAAPAEESASPAEGKDGRSCGLAYFNDAAAPGDGQLASKAGPGESAEECSLAEDSLPSSSSTERLLAVELFTLVT